MTCRNQNIWITGGGSGLGKALAIALADQGNRIIISGRSTANLEAVAELNPQLITAMPCDVKDEHSVTSALRKLDDSSFRLDGIILAAGVCHYIDLPELNISTFRDVMETNFIGTVVCCKAALPYIFRNRKPSSSKPFIAGVCSMSSLAAFPRAEAYGASKAATEYFLRSLRTDLGDTVCINEIQLGFVKTPMTDANDFPMPFMLSAEQAAKRIIRKLGKSPGRIVLPHRLYWFLKIFAMFDSVWFRLIAPKMKRT